MAKITKLQGKRSVDQAELERPLPAPKVVSNTSPFYLAYNPKRWCIDSGRLVPSLARISVEPGVNGYSPDDHVDKFLSEFKNRGWTIIPRKAVTEGYMVEYTNHNGHTIYVTEYEILRAGETRVGRDTQAYLEFVDALMEAGIVDERPETYILEEMRDTVIEQISRVQKGKETLTSNSILERYRNQLEVIDAAIAENEKNEKREEIVKPIRRVPGKRATNKED